MSIEDKARAAIDLAIEQHALRRRSPDGRKAYYEGFLAGLRFIKTQIKDLDEEIEDMILHGEEWQNDA